MGRIPGAQTVVSNEVTNDPGDDSPARRGFFARHMSATAIVVIVVAVLVAGLTMILSRWHRSRRQAAQPAAQFEVYETRLTTTIGPEGAPGAPSEPVAPRPSGSSSAGHAAPPTVPADTAELHLFYWYRGADPGERIGCEWLHEGRPLSRLGAEAVLPAPQGYGRFDVRVRASLPPGGYEAKLRAREAVVATVAFHVPPPITEFLVRNVVTAEGVDEGEAPVGARKSFPPQAPAIYVRFDYENAPVGERLTCRWQHEGALIAKATTTREIGAPNGAGHFYLSNPKRAALPTGRYVAEIVLGEQVLATGEFEVRRDAAPVEEES